MTKNDKLICEFMEYERELERGNPHFWYMLPDPHMKGCTTGFWDTDEAPFSKSWDYLLPVIKKCKERCLDKNHFWKDYSYELQFEGVIKGISNLEFNFKKSYDSVIELIKFIQFEENRKK